MFGSRLWVRFVYLFVLLSQLCVVLPGFAWESNQSTCSLLDQSQPQTFLNPYACSSPLDSYLKIAYGRTYGTSTQLDYATVELSKPVRSYPAETMWGPADCEVQLAFLASYVVYYEGDIEKIKRLDFKDGYEIGCLPKGKFTFPANCLGISPYLESGAGLSYVSETYRNSGSRINWSFICGFGFERYLGDNSLLSFGLQWRHLSNGNMWGKGDELHNSNSGTDMIQGLATIWQKF